MSDQYKMKRQQRVSFNEEQAESINHALNVMKACTGKDVTLNRFIKVSTMERAKRINEKETDNGQKK